ncbi:serine hydrolase domain-containing protein [soil metagenome]
MAKRLRLSLFAALAMAGVTPPAWAQPSPPAQSAPANIGADVDPAALARLSAAMRALVHDHKRAGIAYGVMYKGKMVAMEGIGLRDMAKGLPMTPDSIVFLASMSRAVSTVGFLTLVEEGKVGLDDPVAKYLPEFASMSVLIQSADGKPVGIVPQVRPMTIRHLLTYTSGLGYPFTYPAGMTVDQATLMGPNVTTGEGIRRIAALPLFSQPGDRWRYGFSGDVLGRVAEVVSGQSLDVFLKARVFDQLGMSDTGFWMGPDKVDRLARAYGPKDGKPLADLAGTWQAIYGSFDRPIAFLSGGGGIASTTIDYLKFTQMLVQGGTLNGVRILKPETVTDMLTGHAPLQPGLAYQPDMKFGYGLGVFDEGAKRPGAIKGHEATWGGLANTFFFVDTDHDLAAVAMTQYYGPDPDEFTRTFRDAVYGLLVR